jgi:hypothetical protein
LAVVVGLGISFTTASAVPGAPLTKSSPKMFTSTTYEWVGADFEMGDDSAPLDSPSNWVQNPSVSCFCIGSLIRLCKITVTFTGPAPTKQAVINEVKARYEFNGLYFDDEAEFQVTINGQSVTIKVKLKCGS